MLDCAGSSSCLRLSDFAPSRKTLILPAQLLVVTIPSNLLILSMRSTILSSTEPLGDRSVYVSAGTSNLEIIWCFFWAKSGSTDGPDAEDWLNVTLDGILQSAHATSDLICSQADCLLTKLEKINTPNRV